MKTRLQIHYDHETDTLSVWNGRPVDSSREIQQHLLIELDAHRAPVGFTLEHALEILRPHLPADFSPAETPEPVPTPDSRPAPAVAEKDRWL